MRSLGGGWQSTEAVSMSASAVMLFNWLAVSTGGMVGLFCFQGIKPTTSFGRIASGALDTLGRIA